MNTRIRYGLLMSVALASMTLAPMARAERGTTPQTIAGLGTLTFSTSAKSDAAQSAFVRGLLLLHLFEYPDAATAFHQAEQLDPGFAMAYWGEAMTYNHPVWNELDLAAGRAALRKLGATEAAREVRAPSAREKAYLATINILYFGKATKRQRDARYCDAMQHLATAYPHDNNAQLFYALALLGRNEGVRNIPDYLHAAAIAKHIFKLNPQNPGAAHYWIHGMDDPQHAVGALVAARATAPGPLRWVRCCTSELNSPDPIVYALFLAQLGKRDRALDVLESNVVTRSSDQSQLLWNPGFDPIRNDSRFKAVLQKMGLPYTPQETTAQ